MWRALALTVLLAAGASAQEADLGAPEGAERTLYRARAFDSYVLPTGPVRPGREASETIEGRVVWSAYRLDDPEATTAAIVGGYLARLRGLGFEPIYQCAGEECGGFDFRFGVEVLPAPAMLLDVADFRQLSMRDPAGGLHASILVSRVQKRIYIQTVSVAVTEAPEALGAAPEPGDAEEVVLMPGAQRALAERLRAEGHVAVEGLEFEPGGTALSAASAEALDLLAGVLSRDAELSVVIVGHSDNVGDLDANIDLSRRRAEAVRAALVERGVPESQLAARGVGYLAPVTSNATDEGRARNRRVELVLRAAP